MPMPSRRFLWMLSCLLPLAMPAQAQVCTAEVLAALPVRTGVLNPVAIELDNGGSPLGVSSGVLGQALDEALSVDNVLLRIRQDGCRALAKARPAALPDPNDPAAYKPKTQFDNTPWRFNMTQNGKRMTADEFDAWMKAKGVRVVGRKDPAPAEAPAADAPKP